MGASGISLGFCGGIVEKVHANSNGVNGIVVADGTVSGSTASSNGNVGIEVQRSTVSGNAVSLNGGSGILAGCPSSIFGNTAVMNGLMNLRTFGAGCSVALNAAP